MTAQELGKELANMYFTAKDGERVAMIHLFGIRFSKQILSNKISANEIIKYAKSPDGSIVNKSYFAEINKGVKLAKYVEEKIDKTNMQKANSRKSNRYTNDQIKEILKIRIELAKELISCEIAERETLKIVPTYPAHNLKIYTNQMRKTLAGIGEYGFGYPANWAQALLEITSGEERAQIFKALKEQQRLYLEKDGKNNKKLEKVLQVAEQNLTE